MGENLRIVASALTRYVDSFVDDVDRDLTTTYLRYSSSSVLNWKAEVGCNGWDAIGEWGAADSATCRLVGRTGEAPPFEDAPGESSAVLMLDDSGTMPDFCESGRGKS